MSSCRDPPDPDVTPPQPGRTLLPGPVAQVVSLATRSTGLAIRVGSAASSFGLDAARITTLSTLELARGLVEAVLSRAGRETLERSRSELATLNAESIIERSLENLHHAMTQAVFWTTAGFHFTSTTFNLASEVSQLVLSSLDQLLGSTDSSRAVASIVTLIRREFHDPNTGAKGEPVGVIDLLLGFCAMGYLQKRCWKSAKEEERRLELEETIWDVVVLQDGEKVDVLGPAPRTVRKVQVSEGSRPLSAMSTKRLSQDVVTSEDPNVGRLRDDILKSLPPDTTITITNFTSTTQIITIDIDGPDPIPIPKIPGAEIVETRVPGNIAAARSGQALAGSDDTSWRVVYKLEKSNEASTSLVNYEKKVQTDLGSEKPSDELETGNPRPTSRTARWSGFNNRAPQTDRPPKASKVRQPPTVPTRNTSKPPTISTKDDERSKMKKPASVSQTSPPERQQKPRHEANQKKPRPPLLINASRAKTNIREPPNAARNVTSKKKTDHVNTKATERRASLKQALRGGSQSLANIWHKDSSGSESKLSLKGKVVEGDTTVAATDSAEHFFSDSATSVENQSPSKADPMEFPELIPRSLSRANYVSIQGSRRDSIVSQHDTYSIENPGRRLPQSPRMIRTEFTADSSRSRTPRDVHIERKSPRASQVGHRRIISNVPSIYSLASNDSQSSLVLSPYYQKSPYTRSGAIDTLRRDGTVDGIFPKDHVLRNITRYMRFSSASYGSHFLKFMGISKEEPALQPQDGTHSDVRHFVHHTRSDTSSILLASFVDPEGGTDSSGSTGTGVPLVHYISMDHDAKTVVLACRGTLGFEDVLADMTCDYDFLHWCGREYKVHKGVHASARRLLYGRDGRVLVTLREALVEFPDYGLVLCGHSLGGAVTALLGVMLSEPNPLGSGFVTTAEMRSSSDHHDGSSSFQSPLPPRRPIHVYSYGPPATMSASLRKRTLGLITSVVHGNDVVPYLSLGVLRDFQAVALTFKKEEVQAKSELRQRIWEALQQGISSQWYGRMSLGTAQDPSDWELPVLQILRTGMTNEKLVPPGEVLIIESQRVLRRDAFLLPEEDHMGKPAHRIVLKHVKNAESRFGEMRFGASMLMDHSPAKYEDALDKLRIGLFP